MPIFLDTGDVVEIEKYQRMGIIRGVTTNPTILLKAGIRGGMSAQQCFLAALAGASYVSIFGGRVNNMGYNACEEISKLRRLLDQFKLKAEMHLSRGGEIGRWNGHDGNFRSGRIRPNGLSIFRISHLGDPGATGDSGALRRGGR